jgi:hypothetical protein
LLSGLRQRPDAPSPRLDELARIGHSSGFDALGGAMLALAGHAQATGEQ